MCLRLFSNSPSATFNFCFSNFDYSTWLAILCSRKISIKNLHNYLHLFWFQVIENEKFLKAKNIIQLFDESLNTTTRYTELYDGLNPFDDLHLKQLCYIINSVKSLFSDILLKKCELLLPTEISALLQFRKEFENQAAFWVY